MYFQNGTKNKLSHFPKEGYKNKTNKQQRRTHSIRSFPVCFRRVIQTARYKNNRAAWVGQDKSAQFCAFRVIPGNTEGTFDKLNISPRDNIGVKVVCRKLSRERASIKCCRNIWCPSPVEVGFLPHEQVEPLLALNVVQIEETLAGINGDLVCYTKSSFVSATSWVMAFDKCDRCDHWHQ